MLTLPSAPKRTALIAALASLAEEGGSSRLVAAPVQPDRLWSALRRGPARLAAAVFEAAGMPEPDVVVMGGSGAATAFRTQGKAVVRIGAELAPSAAVASVIRAAATVWRQVADVRPAGNDEEEVATSVYLSLGAAEARAANDCGDRDRAEGLVFLLAAQSIARGDARATAALARELGRPLDVLYEDALRLLALRGEELRERFRMGDADAPAAAPIELIGSPPDHPPPASIRVASLDEAHERVENQPCPCGGRWRIAEQRPGAGDPPTVRFTLVCRVCFRWRTVLWELAAVTA